MDKSRVLAIVGGLAISAAWPVSTGFASIDDHANVTADDHGAQGKPSAKPAPKSAGKPADAKSKSTHAASSNTGDNAHANGSDDTHGHDERAAEAKPLPVSRGARNSNTSEKPPSTAAKTMAANTEASTPDWALMQLVEGNSRWVSGKTTAPNSDNSRRNDVADNGQKPFVTILTCADSRIPVERVFDRGVGDVFVVRVAGNIAGSSETGTIEYGVGHLKTPLLVVMGHTKCGAVAAASTDTKLEGRLGELVNAIKPAVDRAKRNNPGVEDAGIPPIAVRENVWQSVFDLIKGSGEVRHMIRGGELKVIGAVYDIASGKVEFMGEHPWQSELVEAMDARASRTQTAEVETQH